MSIANRTADMALIPGFVDRVGQAAGVGRECADIMNVVLDELINNAIGHGYPRGAVGRIEIALRVDGERFCAEITDDAVAFDPATAPDPELSPDMAARTAGGLGLHFVRNLVQEMSCERRGTTNVTRLSVAGGQVEDRRASSGNGEG